MQPNDNMDDAVVVLISGNGTNLQALIDAKINIRLVVSNRKSAYGLTRAQNAGIPTLIHQKKPYTDSGKTRVDYDRDLADKIINFVQSKDFLIVLAGWMHILGPVFLDKFSNVINLHPALPGAFDGANAIQRAYESFKKGEISKTGVMVHKVITEVDKGEVILFREILLEPNETLEGLEEKIHKVEHNIIVEGVKLALRR